MVEANGDGLSKSVLVLGGTTPGGIGIAIVEELNYRGHLAFAPPKDEVNVLEDDEVMLAINEVKPSAVVYCVGINELDWSWAMTPQTFRDLMDVNVWGFINVMRALQATSRAYSVLAITSDAAVRPMRTSMAYCASKAALDMAIRVASRELASEGWRINGLAPGKVEGTAMTEYVDERTLTLRGFRTRVEAERYEMKSDPLGRKLTAAEVAAVACDVLLSNALAWTGDIVTVNGGR